jgi:hypothetical protein
VTGSDDDDSGYRCHVRRIRACHCHAQINRGLSEPARGGQLPIPSQFGHSARWSWPRVKQGKSAALHPGGQLRVGVMQSAHHVAPRRNFRERYTTQRRVQRVSH